MDKIYFGNTNKLINRLGLGTWQLGTKWGEKFNKDEAFQILDTANKLGINFIDTADIYNDGNSEIALGDYMKKHSNDFYVVTKCGRKLVPHTSEMYTPTAIEEFVDQSLKRLQMDSLDMILLHCPPSEVYDNPSIFEKLDQLKEAGKIKSYGVSIEKVSEGIKALKYNISAIEVIFNMFRLKPAEELFPLAKQKNVGIIVRVPLASGLLTGKYNKNTVFAEGDHRNYNREGKFFDKGETFSGVDYEKGLEAVEELKKLFNTDDLTPYALRYILMFDEVSVVIPGASKKEQVILNNKALDIPPFSQETMDKVKEIYEKYIKEDVCNNW